MFINTFNVFFPHAIIVLSCKFLMLQLRFLYNIRCNSLPNSLANSTIHSPLRSERGRGLQVPKRSAIKECPSPRDADNLSLRVENVCISRRGKRNNEQYK